MRIGQRFIALWGNLFARKRVEAELDAELQGWLEEFTAREVADGVSPAEARKKALAELGGMSPVKERVRAVRVGFSFDLWVRDVRHALRALRRRPGLTIAAVVTMALGIGANSTVFMLGNAVFLRNLPFEDGERIAHVQAFGGVAYPDFLDLRAQSTLLDLGAYNAFPADLSGSGEVPERRDGARISAESFAILGQSPAMGRGFRPEDEGIGADPVALIGYGVWANRFGGDPDFVGSTIRINLVDYTVVGVMPEGEAFPYDTEVWIPLRVEDPTARTPRNLTLFGRLADGATFESADAELDTIVARLHEAYYDGIDGPGLARADVMPFRNRNVGEEIRAVFVGLAGAVGFVLLIACANVANLLLSRVIDRGREMAIRAALGAERWLIIRQVLVESLVMSFAGGVLGMGIAVVAVDWFDRMTRTTGPPYWLEFGVDTRVVMHFFVVCLLAGVLFGALPAFRMARIGDARHLTDRTDTVRGPVRARVSSILVIGEVALTIVLLVGAGLMLRSLVNSTRLTVGFDTSNVLTAGVLLPEAGYPTRQQRSDFVDALLEELASFPGPVTLSSDFPADGASVGTLEIAGRPAPSAAGDFDAPRAVTSVVSISPGYFRTLGLTLERGREFTPADRLGAPRVVIVDTVLAARFWPDEDPVGQRLRVPDDPAFMDDTDAWATVVGVSPRINFTMPMHDDDPNSLGNLFVPFAQDDARYVAVIARGAGTDADTAGRIRSALASIDADLPMADLRTMDAILWEQTWPYRIFSTMFGAFAAGALLMAVVGLYGVTAYGVTVRLKEFGIRMALGAGRNDILWMVLGQGLVRVGIGVTAGLVLAFGVSRILESVLYEVDPGDPITFLGVAALLGIVAMAACLIPASRAVRIDPGRSLRQN